MRKNKLLHNPTTQPYKTHQLPFSNKEDLQCSGAPESPGNLRVMVFSVENVNKYWSPSLTADKKMLIANLLSPVTAIPKGQKSTSVSTHHIFFVPPAIFQGKQSSEDNFG